MLKIGITGGIGSGKTTVCKIFEILGIPIFYADSVAKSLLETDLVLKQEMIKSFGSLIYQGSRLNRKLLASIVFNDAISLSKLNDLVHSRIRIAFEKWCSEKAHMSYVIEEAAILFETGFYKEMDKTILVCASIETRIKRVMQRDNIPESEVTARIKNQLPDEEKIKLADFIIYNEESKPLIKQVLTIHHLIMEI